MAGVSKSTVSAVINNSRPVTVETRARVVDAARALNYQPSAKARHLRDNGSRCIGLIIKERGNPFYDEVAMGAMRVASEAGYSLYVASSEGDYGEEGKIIDDLRNKGVNGLIISPVLNEQTDLSSLFMLRQARYPFVLLERIFGVQANIVDVDNAAASKEAVQHLIREGHSSIVHFAGPPYSMHTRERIDGVRQAFSESRLVFREDTVVEAGCRFSDGYRTALSFFGERDEASWPTAVTCFNDLVALGVWAALRELNVAVPERVSIIGYDDLHLLRFLPEGLSSVHTQIGEMGEVAARMLIEHIESREELAVERRTLPARLELRQTTRSLSSVTESTTGQREAAGVE